MRGEAPASPFTSVPGWHHDLSEEQYYIALASALPDDAVMVEVGVEYGRGSAALLFGAPNARLYAVDLFPNDYADIHRSNLIEAGYAGRFEQVQGDSAETGNHWTIPADLILIDADHHYEPVRRDIAAWVRHVKPGGYLIFHDCAPRTNPAPHDQHLQVQRAVSEWYQVGGYPMFQELSPCWSVRAFQRVR